jgi:hypothetical protein
MLKDNIERDVQIFLKNMLLTLLSNCKTFKFHRIESVMFIKRHVRMG